MMDELYNCPICGGECKITQYEYYGKKPTFGVRCLECGLETRSTFLTKIKVKEYWNNRCVNADKH